MSKKTTLDLLVDNILNYVEYLKEQPHIMSDQKSSELLTKFRAQYLMLSRTDPKMILNYFTEYIYPHKEEIMSNNEHYFLELGEEHGIKASMMEALHIKEFWKEKFTEENKKTTFTYFKVYIKLVEKCLVEHLKKK